MSATAAPATPTATDRDAKGRFVPGNGGGPGNPFARRTAAIRKRLLDRVTDDDIDGLVDALLTRAKSGDVPALRLALSYLAGKPLDTPDPDRMDLHEWNQQKDEAAMVSQFADVIRGAEPARLVQLMRDLRPCVMVAIAGQLAQVVRDADAGRPPTPPVTPSPNGAAATEAPVAKPAKRKPAHVAPRRNDAAPAVRPSTNGGEADPLSHLFEGDPVWLDRLRQVGPPLPNGEVGDMRVCDPATAGDVGRAAPVTKR